MRRPYDPSRGPLTEGDHSQLWLRQRRLRVQATSEEADDSTCRFGNTKDGSAVGAVTIDSAEILGGHREVQIVHAGETYRLLVTRNNKLILQK